MLYSTTTWGRRSEDSSEHIWSTSSQEAGYFPGYSMYEVLILHLKNCSDSFQTECLPRLGISYPPVSMKENLDPTHCTKFLMQLLHATLLISLLGRRRLMTRALGRCVLCYLAFKWVVTDISPLEYTRKGCCDQISSEASGCRKEVQDYHSIWCTDKVDWEWDEGDWGVEVGGYLL